MRFWQFLHRFLPFLAWPRPQPASLRKDIIAGVTVGVVLVPQALAYAALAGMPPVTGLYAALLPSLVGALWGSSSLLAVGPVALTSLLTFTALQPLAVPGSAEWVGLAIWLAIYAGLIQLALGVLRLGVIANFISNAVVVGFINAAALIILFTQVPALLGLPKDVNSQWLAQAVERFNTAPKLLLTTAAFGLGTLLLLVLLRRFAPRVPGALLVCIVSLAVSSLFGFAAAGGSVVGTIPAGLPELLWPPAIDLAQHRALLPAALIIALISFTEAMSSCRVLASRRNEAWDQDQELIGQGLAKIVSGISGAFPVSGSFSRSALNAYAGAQSSWSTLAAAACVLVCLLWFTDYLYHLPQAVLAAIIIVPVVGLLNAGAFRRLWRVSRADGAVAMTTFAVTLLSAPNLHWGVFAGFALSLLCFLCRQVRPRIVELGLHESGALGDRKACPLPPIAPDVLAVRMDASLTYITAPLLERFVRERLRSAAGVRVVLLCSSPINDIDVTGIDILHQLHRELAERGVRLCLSGVKAQVRNVMQQSGLLAMLGEDALFPDNRTAVEALASLTSEASASR